MVRKPRNDLHQDCVRTSNERGMTKKKLTKPKGRPKKPEQVQTPLPEEEKTLDFGGLPQRDIKKNLGCG